MSRYTITPWRTQSDLLAVRQQLYSLDTTATEDLRRPAVERIMAWKLRGNLPHAVESTALLVDAILHHDLSVNSIFSVRAVYAAAFTRFVTGFCDIGRNRERALDPSSMLQIARQIDMPDEFVALRHEATHEDLPSVQRLVAVCGQALEWLWRVYWSRLAEEPVVEPVEVTAMDLQQVRDEGRRVLKEFRSARKQTLKGKGGSAQELIQKTTSECQTLCRDQEPAITVLTGTLIGDKMLYPSDRGLGAPMNGAYLLWDGLLQSFSKRQSNFLPTLLKGIHTAMIQPGTYHQVSHDPEKEALHHWLLHIATSDVWSKVRRETGNEVDAQLMTLCCLHPSHWSQSLGEELLQAGDEIFVESWSDLLMASAIAGSAMMAETGNDITTQDVDMSNGAQDIDGSVVGTDFRSDAGASLPAWREALMPPTVPIGLVR
ncbi:hypothetical protein Q7P37_002177 [Cladosporium fusiforme]